MGFLDWILGKKSEGWYLNELSKLLSRRVSHEHKIRNAKAGLKRLGQEKLLTGSYSETQLRQELEKLEQNVVSIGGLHKVDNLKRDRLSALSLAVKVMQLQRELINEVDIHINNLVIEMKGYGYRIPKETIKDIEQNHPSMNPVVRAHISEIAVS